MPDSAASDAPCGMRFLVCGGRTYGDAAKVDRILSRIRAKRGISVIIQGGAAGADRLAARWGEARKIPVLTFKADWDRHSAAAGPIRNTRMLAEGKPDGVVAFEGATGTADMVRKARIAGVKVWEV